ncbi:MAG: biotin/lipoyl-containing protein [Anaerolineales bacterium]
MKYLTTVNNEQYEIEIRGEGVVLVNGEARQVDFKSMGEHAIYSMIIDNQSFEAVVEQRDGVYHVLIFGDLYEINVMDERTQRLLAAGGRGTEVIGDVVIKAPMPGLIVDVPVAEGQQVTKGQTVVILESMKMENELKAPRDGVIHHIEVRAGQSVNQQAVLLTIT